MCQTPLCLVMRSGMKSEIARSSAGIVGRNNVYNRRTALLFILIASTQRVDARNCSPLLIRSSEDLSYRLVLDASTEWEGFMVLCTVNNLQTTSSRGAVLGISHTNGQPH